MKWLSFLLLALFVEAAQPQSYAIVTQDRAALRPAPKPSAQPSALLWQGETLEVRGERLDYLQVWDHARERGGYVHASLVRRVKLKTDEAPELLAALRFIKTLSDSEALGIGLAAAYIEAAPPEALQGPAGIEVLDALGSISESLAARLSRGTTPTLAAHLEVARRYGVRFVSVERDERMTVCYDGTAFRKVLGSSLSSPGQRARAALSLTRPDCIPGDLGPGERRRIDEARAEALDEVDERALPAYVKNRVLMRRAAVWASLAYQRARAGDAHQAAAERALSAISLVNKSELAEGDRPAYGEAAMRVNASRWASVVPKKIPLEELPRKRPHIITVNGAPGETCVVLMEANKAAAKRCTYSLVWLASATSNREGTALAVAVQPTESWRELWLFHKTKAGWAIRILPPSSSNPNVGYAEFAGWPPGGSQVLVAREAIGQRRFELLRLDTLVPVRHANEPVQLAAFQRWQDPSWKRQTLSLR